MSNSDNHSKMLKELNRSILLSGNTEKLLFLLFWHEPTQELLHSVDPEVLVHLCLHADLDANRERAELEAGQIVLSFAQAKLLRRTWKGANVLSNPLVLTEEGESFVRMNNLPPRPIEIFLKEIVAHKVAIISTIVGLVAGAITIYQVFMN